MERTPHNGDHVFEVSIFNKDVRSLVKENMSLTLAEEFLFLMRKTLDALKNNKKSTLNQIRKGKGIPH